MTMNFGNDEDDLNRMLSVLDAASIDLLRLQTVRRSILLAADAHPKQSGFFLFRLQPALLTATALLGLVLGISVPVLDNSDSISAYFDSQPSYLDGGFG